MQQMEERWAITGFADDLDGIRPGYLLIVKQCWWCIHRSIQTSGVVRVLNTTLIDYESNQSLEIEVTAKPPIDGSSTTQVYTIDVLDYNEFPVGPVTDSDTVKMKFQRMLWREH